MVRSSLEPNPGAASQESLALRGAEPGHVALGAGRETPTRATSHHKDADQVSELALLTPIYATTSEPETSSMRLITSDLRSLALSEFERLPTGTPQAHPTSTFSSMDVSDFFSPDTKRAPQRLSMARERPPMLGRASGQPREPMHRSPGCEPRDRHIPPTPTSVVAPTRTTSDNLLDDRKIDYSSRQIGTIGGVDIGVERSKMDTDIIDQSMKYGETLPSTASEVDRGIQNFWSGMVDEATLRSERSSATSGFGKRPVDARDAFRSADTSSTTSTMDETKAGIMGRQSDPDHRTQTESVLSTGRRATTTDRSAPVRDLNATKCLLSDTRMHARAALENERRDFQQDVIMLQEKIHELEEQLHRSTRNTASVTASTSAKGFPTADVVRCDVSARGRTMTSASNEMPRETIGIDTNTMNMPQSTHVSTAGRGDAQSESSGMRPSETHTVARTDDREYPSSTHAHVVASSGSSGERVQTQRHNAPPSPTSSSVASPTVSITPLLTPMERPSLAQKFSLQTMSNASVQSTKASRQNEANKNISVAFMELPRATLCQRLETTLRQLNELQAVVDQQFDMIARLDRERNTLYERLASTEAAANIDQTTGAKPDTYALFPSDQEDEKTQQVAYWRRRYEDVCRKYRVFAAEKTHALRSMLIRNERLERLVERLQQQLHEAEQDMNRARDRLIALRQENQRLRTWVLENGLTLTPGRLVVGTHTTSSP
ncbi:hypothetical protein F1559_002920 [Cyanidiococcus yangmingshanensis]|uniref:Uncharacterized protein n=1 Tax=Cyanidiococcus yangmingshanensis TaxID=2690220 RepID=A0A7J7IH90_9RHOD|nr:hypothetical protein F1559_002920 [Cyanidiococcus yangmingshanensis]